LPYQNTPRSPSSVFSPSGPVSSSGPPDPAGSPPTGVAGSADPTSRRPTLPWAQLGAAPAGTVLPERSSRRRRPLAVLSRREHRRRNTLYNVRQGPVAELCAARAYQKTPVRRPSSLPAVRSPVPSSGPLCMSCPRPRHGRLGPVDHRVGSCRSRPPDDTRLPIGHIVEKPLNLRACPLQRLMVFCRHEGVR